MAQVTQHQAEQHVRNGLANRSRGPLPNLAGLGDLLNFEKLNTYAQEAGRRAQRLAEFHAGLAAAFEKFEAEEIPKREKELRGLPLSSAQRLDHLRRIKDAERRRLLEINTLAKERTEMLQQLREQRDRALAVRELWSNPVSVMVRMNANTEAAARWREAAKTWKANQLRDQIDVARMTADHALLTVCFERLDALEPDDRKHVARSKSDVIQQMPVAALAARALMACDAIALVHDRADMRRREVEGQPIAPNEKIDIGARAQLLAPFFEEEQQQE